MKIAILIVCLTAIQIYHSAYLCVQTQGTISHFFIDKNSKELVPFTKVRATMQHLRFMKINDLSNVNGMNYDIVTVEKDSANNNNVLEPDQQVESLLPKFWSSFTLPNKSLSPDEGVSNDLFCDMIEGMKEASVDNKAVLDWLFYDKAKKGKTNTNTKSRFIGNCCIDVTGGIQANTKFLVDFSYKVEYKIVFRKITPEMLII